MKARIKDLPRLAALLCGAALSLQVPAATLTSAYEFNGNLNDSVLEGHDDALVSGTRGSGSGTVTASNFVFGGNQGVTLSNALADIDNYSVELYFSFDALGQDNNYRNILDPGLARDDRSLYARGDERVHFYNGPVSAPDVLVQGALNHLVFTRATSGIQVFVNGALVLSDNSPTTIAVSQASDNVLHVFEDDAGEVAPGTLEYLRLYNGVLDAGEVSTLYSRRDQALDVSAVPVPASLPLLVSALGVIAARRRMKSA